MNSSYNEDAKIAEKLGPETVMLHPADADAPRLAATATRCSPPTRPAASSCASTSATSCRAGVALSHKSRWPKLLQQHANINALNPGRKTDMAESSAVHSVEVTLTKKA